MLHGEIVSFCAQVRSLCPCYCERLHDRAGRGYCRSKSSGAYIHFHIYVQLPHTVMVTILKVRPIHSSMRGIPDYLQEMFVEKLATAAHQSATANKRKTIKYVDSWSPRQLDQIKIRFGTASPRDAGFSRTHPRGLRSFSFAAGGRPSSFTCISKAIEFTHMYYQCYGAT